jgi:hypothetical protein
MGIIHLPEVYVPDRELNTPSFGCALFKYLHMSKEPPVASVGQDCCILNSINTVF